MPSYKRSHSLRHFQRRGEAVGNRNVTWISPQGNQTYPAGQTLVAKWDTLLALIVPSFRLCVGESDRPVTERIPAERCGSMVNPLVQQQIDGLYFVSLSIPNVTSTQPFILRLQDTLGYEFDSPRFYLGQASPDRITPAAQGNSSDVSSPVVTPSLPPGLLLNLTDAIMDGSSSTLNPLMVLEARSNDPNLLFAGRKLSPSSLAAVLIPVVLVAFSLAFALFLAFRRHRQQELRPLILTEKRFLPRRPSPRTLNSAEDLEYAIRTLSAKTTVVHAKEGSVPCPPLYASMTRGDFPEGFGLPELHFHGYQSSSIIEKEFLEEVEGISPHHPEHRSLTESYFSSVPPLPSSPLEHDSKPFFSQQQHGDQQDESRIDSDLPYSQSRHNRLPTPESAVHGVLSDVNLSPPSPGLVSPPLSTMRKLSERFQSRRTRTLSPEADGFSRSPSPLRVESDLGT